jgi:predicted nucleic acid-binding protein
MSGAEWTTWFMKHWAMLHLWPVDTAGGSPTAVVGVGTETSFAVLDSNVVLDWLYFGDERVAAVAAAIECGTLKWLASAAMREELLHVLGRGIASPPSAPPDRLWATWKRLCVEHEEPSHLPQHRMRCTDRDDQKFIDFALAYRAGWLITRDRALLKLARRASAARLSIVTPEQWTARIASDSVRSAAMAPPEEPPERT